MRSKRSAYLRQHTQWQWHFDEVFVKINGVQPYLWRAVGYEGEVLESYVTRKRDKLAALGFLKKCDEEIRKSTHRRHRPAALYGAAMTEIGNLDRQEVGQTAG